MLPQRPRRIQFENVPSDAASSFTCREFKWPRFPFNWHYHPEIELTLIIKGRGLRFVGDSVEEFADGDFCLLGGGLPHCWASHPNSHGGVHSIVVQFLPDTWGAPFWALPEMRKLRLLLDQARRGLVIRGPVRKQLAGTMLEMTRRHSVLQRWTSLLGILAELTEKKGFLPLASADYEQPSVEQTDRKLGRVLGFIHAQLENELTQQRVAESVRMSPQAFSRFFKRAVGKPYIVYVNELKIHKACRILIETDATITEAAFQAGFGNLSHFNEQFRRLKNMTPGSYRRRASNFIGQ